MNLSDWLFCKFNHICTKHLIRKKVLSNQGGTYAYCPECRNESSKKFNATMKRILGKKCKNDHQI